VYATDQYAQTHVLTTTQPSVWATVGDRFQ